MAPRSIRAVRALRQSDTDACPGALRLHAAADGLLARVRLPGGVLSGAQLRSLRELAERFGDGWLELTSRANLQLRGLRAEDAETLAAGLRTAGLLPSATHDAVRNIAAPPPAGPSTRALVTEVDDALCGDPALARLPGKFLFAIGHVPLAADVAAVPAHGPEAVPAAGPAAGPAGRRFALRFAGRDTGLRVGAEQVVPALITAAHAFLAEREAQRPAARADRPGAGTGRPAAGPDRPGVGAAAWRLRELADGPARVSARVASALGLTPAPVAPATPVPVLQPADLLGTVELDEPGRVAVGALVPLGRLSGVQLRALEPADRLVVTPWRGVLVADLPPVAAPGWTDRLVAAGLAVAADSAWVGVTACAGRPGCARSLADVRADATAAARFVDGLPVHWAGCERACGSPAGRHVLVQATPDGYQVAGTGARRDTEALSNAIALARRP